MPTMITKPEFASVGDYFPKNEKNILRQMIGEITRIINPKRYMEIGVREGDSLLEVVKNSSLEFLEVVDDWGKSYSGTGRGSHRHIRYMLEPYSIPAIAWMDGDSKETLPLLWRYHSYFDMITVDGDHSEIGFIADLVNSWALVKKGGYIICDDLIQPKQRHILKHFETWAKRYDAENVFQITGNRHGLGIIKKI